MRNQYPGICYRCKKTVAAKEGHFEILPKSERKGKKWVVQHANCAIIFRGTKVGKENMTTEIAK